ncbi:MAG: Predicted L-rhamnose ABC transporter, substrate-binding component [uncultured Rubrobacteraceae bacterium]|uniref:Autoinducer 2-binding protein LsrB n=1 Tax=uncultured Rubrobacteraceae bacterium TaxID=349277 RepID=A0A6J4QSX4_9ACTN|nr:MAG: Predicted L-rhamnose ABC transporter, substrate-binding component [uncultured Rubrobacteraceae bacterium]
MFVSRRNLKVLSAALFAALVATAVSCGVGQQPSQGGGGGGGPAKICMMPKLVGIPYFNASEEGAEEAAKELDVELVYDGPTEAKAALQSQMIEQFIQQQCGAITVAANDPNALAPAMKKAGDAGIATGAWDADVAPEARDVFVNQATFQAIGYELVDVMAAQTDGKGKFLVVTGSLTAPNQVAWLKEMRERMKEKYPEMEISSVEPGEEDLQLGIDITKNYLRANPDTAGVFGITSVALPGAAEAVEQAGLEGEVAVTGLSTPNEMKPYLESGAVEEFVLWNPVDLGYLAVHVANAQIEDKMPKSGTFEAGRLGKVEVIAEDEVLLGPPLVFSKENINDYDF